MSAMTVSTLLNICDSFRLACKVRPSLRALVDSSIGEFPRVAAHTHPFKLSLGGDVAEARALRELHQFEEEAKRLLGPAVVDVPVADAVGDSRVCDARLIFACVGE